MNQMYLSDIDLMKFEHSICSDLDMFMIECYDDYYYTEAEAKEGIFQKIKRKIKEIFEKLKAIFRGNKVKQMDANIKEAEKAVQQISSEQKNGKVEVFDGEKALKLIEEDHEKAKKDPNHKRLDKKKLIALCTIPVTIAVAVGILIKNRKALPKILDKEKEINKEVEQAEKEEEKQVEKVQNEVKKEVQKQQEQVKKEVQKAQEKIGMDPDLKAAIYQGSELIANHNDKKTQWENDQISKMNDQMKARERKERKEFMSAYRKDTRNARRSTNSFMSSNETFRTNINETDKRFITYQEKIFGKQTKALVGLYTIIIDTSTKTAKEIIDILGQHNIAYIKNVEVDSSGVHYNSILRNGYHGLYRSKT